VSDQDENQSGLKIWVLEDEPVTAFAYAEAIGSDYVLRFFPLLNDFIACVNDSTILLPDLIIADLNLPDGSFLNYLEKHGILLSGKCPIVVVSCAEEPEILRKCFDNGAADYLTKPFSLNELRVKINRLLCRAPATYFEPDNNFLLDARTFEMHVNGKVSPTLTQKEFQIMALLKDAPNATLDKAALNSLLQGLKQVGPKALDVHLVNLRRKLAKVNYQINSVDNQEVVLCRMPGPLG
jgi:DNA-binding response OmpR family regulator